MICFALLEKLAFVHQALEIALGSESGKSWAIFCDLFGISNSFNSNGNFIKRAECVFKLYGVDVNFIQSGIHSELSRASSDIWPSRVKGR